MQAWISTCFLIAGAGLCLVAAIGVLRLPDFFLRMHAATEAGVVGCGLILIGVGLAHPSFEMWIKIAVAISFLLITTPIAGHLLARAGYVAGMPLWNGTMQDALRGELPRGEFERPLLAVAEGSEQAQVKAALNVASKPAGGGEGRNGLAGISQIVLALAEGPNRDAAISFAIALAKSHCLPLVGLAVIDRKLLENVGPVPIGGNFHAQQLRNSRVEKARRVVADLVEQFERQALEAGIVFSLIMEEGDPRRILKARVATDTLILAGRQGWFDQGVVSDPRDPLRDLVRHGIWPLLGVSDMPRIVRSVSFIHEGSAQSDETLHWFLRVNPWPHAALHLAGADEAVLAKARNLARAKGIYVTSGAVDTLSTQSDVVVFGNESHAGWLARAGHAPRPSQDASALVVFG